MRSNHWACRLGRWLVLAGGVGGTFIAARARASAESFAEDVVLVVSKSENKNQVHYAVQMDDACRLAGRAPVRAFWRMFERGPRVVEPLLDREQRIYGLGAQEVTGSQVVVRIRALPDRPLTVHTRRDIDGSCRAAAYTTLAGVPARVDSVYVQLAWPFGIRHLVLGGRRVADNAPVREVVEP